MTNPLFLRYRYLDSLRLCDYDAALFKRIISLSPFSCPLRVRSSSLTRHSFRCYHYSQHYRFPKHVSIASLFHNIYGTNFLDNSKFSSFVNPIPLNRNLIGYHLGCTIESNVYDYSILTEAQLSLTSLSSLSSEILSLVFINTIEIASSLYSTTEPYRQHKLSFYLPILFAICDIARTWPGYPPASRLLFDVETLSSLQTSSAH